MNKILILIFIYLKISLCQWEMNDRYSGYRYEIIINVKIII